MPSEANLNLMINHVMRKKIVIIPHYEVVSNERAIKKINKNEPHARKSKKNMAKKKQTFDALKFEKNI